MSTRSTLAAGAEMDLVNAPNPTAVTAIQNGLAATGEAATAVGTLNDFDPATEEVNVGSVNGAAVTSIDDFKADVSGLALIGEAATAVGTLTIPSAADNADAVWNEARVDHSTAGSFGQGVASVQGNVTGSVDSVTDPVTVGTNNDKTDYALSAAGVSAVQSGLSTLTAKQVWEYGTRTLSSFGTLVSDVATGVWGAGTRTLSGFGTLIADTWAHATRSLTDKADFTLTAAYDAAKTAASTSDVTTAVSGLSTFDPATTEVDIGKVKGVAVTSVADFKADVSGLAATGEAATAVATLNDFDPATDVVAHVTLVDTTTTNTDMRGTDNAELSGAATAALAAYDPPTKAELDAAVSPLAVEATLTAIKGAGWSTETLAAIKAVLDTAAADVANIDGAAMRGTDGAELAGAAATAVAGLNDFDPATDVVAHVTLVDTVTTNTDMRGTDGAELSGAAATAVGTLTIPTAEAISDTVWNEATADHQTAGSTGNALSLVKATTDKLDDTVEDDLGTYRFTENALEQVPSGTGSTPQQIWEYATRTITGGAYNGTPPSAADIATAVWGSTTRSLTTFGSLVADTVAAVWGAVARTITGGTVTTNSDKTGYSLAADQAVNVTKVAGSAVTGVNDFKADVSGLALAGEADAAVDTLVIPSAADNADAVWDAPTSSHQISGSTGVALTSAGSAGDPWSTTLPGEYADGTAGSLLSTNLDARVSDAVAAGAGANTIVVTVDDGAAALDGAIVQARTVGGSVYQAATDADGIVTFLLDDATYEIYVGKPGYEFTNPTELVVNGDETLTISGAEFSPGLPDDPSLCRVYGWIKYPEDAGPVASRDNAVTARFEQTPMLDVTAGVGFDKGKATADTDAAGYFEIDLVWSSEAQLQGVASGLYRLQIPSIGYDKLVLVPDETSVLFTALTGVVPEAE